MKKNLVLIFSCLLVSAISYAQTFESLNEQYYETVGSSYENYSYWDNFQGHYNGTTFEMDYTFTYDGYFEYSITVYPYVFADNANGAYNELTVYLTDEDQQVDFTDYSYPLTTNTSSITKSGSFYVGTPTTGHSMLFGASYLSSDMNTAKYGGLQGACTVHW
jgi:hypothetical protein